MLTDFRFISKLKGLYLLQGQSIKCLVQGLILFTFSIIITTIETLVWLPTFINISLSIVSIVSMCLSWRFFILSYKMTNSIWRQSSENIFEKRNINIKSGTYNEAMNVQGDNIAGDKNISILYQFDLCSDI